jgi:protein SCO1/2
VEELEIGDAVPDYKFTNELGQAVSLSQFKGEAVALTFIFTTCPYPTYCPRMAQNFAATANKLKETSGAPKNWRLLSISFDTEIDTPPVLLKYARTYDYDPKHWSFLTGDLAAITELGDQLGVMFWRAEGTISHNLRTAVIDSQGRLQKVFEANEWKPEELAEELIKAAQTSG